MNAPLMLSREQEGEYVSHLGMLSCEQRWEPDYEETQAQFSKPNFLETQVR